MALSTFARVLAGGALSGAQEYNRLQEEQRKYKVDQTKAQAEEKRRLNFMKQSKIEGYKYTPTGLMTRRGKSVSQSEYGALTEPERSALESKEDVAARATVKAEGRVKTIAEERRRVSKSEFIDAKTKTILTTGEYEDRVASGEDPAEFAISKFQQDVDKGVKTSEAAEERLKQREVASFMKSLNKTIMAPVDDLTQTQSDKTKAIVEAMRGADPGSERWEAAMKIGAVAEAMIIARAAVIAKDAYDLDESYTRKSVRLKSAKEELLGRGIPESQVDTILKYAGLKD